MDYRIKLTSAAKKHLKSIWQYTYDKWGIQQADIYLKGIESTLNQLAKMPNLGRKRPEISICYHSIQYKKHVVFYLQKEFEIQVIGVLHEKMDYKSHLKK